MVNRVSLCASGDHDQLGDTPISIGSAETSTQPSALEPVSCVGAPDVVSSTQVVNRYIVSWLLSCESNFSGQDFGQRIFSILSFQCGGWVVEL